MLELPPTLVHAISTALAQVPSARWIRAATALSERYRGERVAGNVALAQGSDMALGYAAMILPATYAQLRGAMAAIAARLPGWQPRSVLDLGSGPGTALWAALATWPSLTELVAWEREAAFVTLGQQFASHGGPALRATHWLRRDLQQLPASGPPADLVIIGHVLNELDPSVVTQIVANAWAHTSAILLLVEPGTSAAFPVVRAARDQLLAAGAITIAPCPHNLACPLQNDWCHFPQRVQRPEFQRRARGGSSQWEDAKYSYAAMARFAVEQPITARVIREPSFNKAYAEAMLCTQPGIVQHRALKRNQQAFRQVRNLVWGEALDELPG